MGYSYSSNRTGTATTVIARRRIDMPAWHGTNADPSAWLVLPFDQPFLCAPPAGQTLMLDATRYGISPRDFQLLNRMFLDSVADTVNMPFSILTSTTSLQHGYGTVIGLVSQQPNAVPRLTASGLVATGEPLVLTLDQVLPRNLAGVALGLSNGSLLGSIPLPFSLAAFGAPGCTVLTSSDLTVWGVADAYGALRLELPVPAAPWLARMQTFEQGLALDPANALGLVTSNGLATVLGGHP
jgi:hypothetical protein